MKGTNFLIIDNSGGQAGLCINVFKQRSCEKLVGRMLIVVVKKIRKKVSKVRTGQISRAIIVRTNQKERHIGKFWVRFSQNGVVLLNKSGEMVGNRIVGIISRRLVRLGLGRVVALAKNTY